MACARKMQALIKPTTATTNSTIELILTAVPAPPPVNMIRLTEEREITPYVWVHPD